MPENVHDVRPDESMCLIFFDRAVRLGGLVRVGNLPREGHAEVAVVLFQPDGSVLFDYQRAEIASSPPFQAGGACFEALGAPQRLRVTYDGAALHLLRPLDLEEPGRAVAASPRRGVRLALDCAPLSPLWGDEIAAGQAGAFSAERHCEQQVRPTGSLVIDGQGAELDALGLRYHSRAPRGSALPRSRRRLTCAFDEGFGFVASRLVTPDGTEQHGGFLFKDGRNCAIEKLLMHTDWTAQGRYPSRIGLILGSTAGELRITGKVFNMVPLPDRRDGEAAALSAGMTLWRCGPHVGYGLSEYLEQAA